MISLTSYGAANGVTGSCHLLEVGSSKILLDCGIFQGRGQSERNEPPFPFDPSQIDALLVSHAHLDHIGRIPLLCKEGFRGRIYATRPTYELSRISLLDSARIMDSDATRANRKRREEDPVDMPLYDEDDVFELIDQWNDLHEYQQRVEIGDHVALTFHDAGHILGSAFMELELDDGTTRKKLVFSGDLGNIDKPIIRDPENSPKADVVLMESTYGDRSHRPFARSREELIAQVRQTIERDGNVLIPAFAMERSQELLYVLHQALIEGELPSHTTIYLDSPMAIDATRIFERHPGCYDEEALALRNDGHNLFNFSNLHYTRHSSDSMRINDHRAGAVIIAGSGMLTGGRMLHHLRHNLDRPECSVIFCGYQGEGTLGRRLVDGADEISIFHHRYPVRASIHTINGFSGHAGQDILTEWALSTQAPRVLLVHGEEQVKRRFASHLSAQPSIESIMAMPFARTIEL